MKMNDALFSSTLIVGVAGGTGSGKSTLVEMLLASDIGEEIALLPHDHYYLSWDEVPTDLRESQNWDHPDAIDNTLYVQHLDQLARGQSVPRPNYCFETYRRKEEPTHLMAKKILLVEGILVLASGCPETCLIRRIVVPGFVLGCRRLGVIMGRSERLG